VMEGRRKRLEELCKKFEVETRIEHSSLFHRSEPINRCTGRFFKFQEKDFFICNVLKGGSTSWSFFFGENNITAAFIADCRENGTCPKKSELRLLQVRHPLERLLATWRHLFKNGGWKSLDGAAATKPELKKEMEKKLAGFTWNYFVEEVVLKDTFVKKSEVEMNNFDEMGSWVKHHWAPYWYTCGVCTPGNFPDFILKTETLPWDIPLVLKEMKMPDDIVFPDIRVTGSDDNGSEGNKPSENYVQKYYSRLTKLQVLRLYQLYKMDHDMFDYSPETYIAFAK